MTEIGLWWDCVRLYGAEGICKKADTLAQYDRTFERYIARLVGDGACKQIGDDCGGIFSMVVKSATIRY
jgi:hypothetical protein